MKKKTLVVILILSHLLCIIFGYCVALVQNNTKESTHQTSATTEATATANTDQTIPTMEKDKETVVATIEEIHVKETETTEMTEPSVTEPVKQPSVTQPPVTESPATQPPATTPPVTTPPVTEPPATQPPATNPPGGGSGSDYETDRDF